MHYPQSFCSRLVIFFGFTKLVILLFTLFKSSDTESFDQLNFV